MATVCVREHETSIPYGVIKMDDLQVLSIEEKPVLHNYVNAGIYLLSPSLLEIVPKNHFFDMPQLLKKAIELNNSVTAFPINEYWLDIGNPETFEKAWSWWK